MKHLARLISEAANPLFVALPTLLAIALTSAPTLAQGLLWWGITAVGVSIAPFLFVLRGVRRGHYSDHHVSRREQRFVPMIVTIGLVALTFVLLAVIRASGALLATLTAVLLALGIATIITTAFKWKISLHLVGVAGAVTVFVLLFGPLWLVLAPLVLLVAWARWKVQAHTWLQALAGTILAAGVTVVIFWLFGLLH
jgi:hypothetical protein